MEAEVMTFVAYCTSSQVISNLYYLKQSAPVISFEDYPSSKMKKKPSYQSKNV